MITVNGQELEFSFFNPEHVKKYEAARKEIAEKYAAIQSIELKEDDLTPYIEQLKQGCQAVFSLFDGIFGEGTAHKLFGDETDFEKCIDAYLQFEEGIAGQADRLGRKVSKYAPNRQTRRA